MRKKKSNLEQVSTLQEFYEFAINFYYQNKLKRPVNFVADKVSKSDVKKLKKVGYPADFIEWHEEFGGNYFGLEEIVIDTTSDVVSDVNDYYKMYAANGFLLIATDGAGNSFHYDMNVKPPVIKFSNHETTNENEDLLEETYSEVFDFWEEGDDVYHNPKGLDVDKIYDANKEFIIDSPYIQEYLSKQLTTVSEFSNFLDMLKVSLAKGFVSIMERYTDIDYEGTLKELNPDYRRFHNKAHRYENNGMLELGIREYHRANLIEENYNSTFNIGAVYADLDDYETAIEYYNKSLEMNPKYKLGYNNRSFANYCLGNYKMALADISKVIKMDKNYALAYATKAEILFALNDDEGFYEFFEISVKKGIDPNILDSGIAKKYGSEERYKSIVDKYS